MVQTQYIQKGLALPSLHFPQDSLKAASRLLYCANAGVRGPQQPAGPLRPFPVAGTIQGSAICSWQKGNPAGGGAVKACLRPRSPSKPCHGAQRGISASCGGQKDTWTVAVLRVTSSGDTQVRPINSQGWPRAGWVLCRWASWFQPAFRSLKGY